ncbi:serine hydrolase domain-containing protein [Deinococcus ficus]|uniref:serine hydrolase domain-containing protein n=1 Tax=Deinococcus ficus TaxID=317577 RepID=UPI0003B4BF54|nr:serine hydrolase [Deinococcus ficus]
MVTGHDLPTTTPTEAGLDPGWLNSAVVTIRERFPHVTSLLVARDGHLAFEQYFGIQQDDPQDLQSVTKSVGSLLTGVAVQHGVLSVDRPVLEQWPEAVTLTRDPRWQRVTVGHLLTMTSGLPSEITDPVYDEAWFHDADPLRFTLGQTLSTEPGQAFHYSNAGVHLLGALVSHRVGQPLEEFAQEVLFTPLGIPSRTWMADPQGRVWGSGSLHLTPREMLRMGQVVLQEGRWHSRSVVSAAWIQQMTRPRVKGYAFMEGMPDYGWLWWLAGSGETPGWYATGYGGQYIAVFPALRLVVVMTGQVCDHPNHRSVIVDLTRQVAAADLS